MSALVAGDRAFYRYPLPDTEIAVGYIAQPGAPALVASHRGVGKEMAFAAGWLGQGCVIADLVAIMGFREIFLAPAMGILRDMRAF